MKYTKHILGFVVLFFVVIVCGTTFLSNTTRLSPEITTLINKKIDDFHQKLIQGKFADIYSESDSQLKDKFGEREFIEYLRKAKEQFGNNLPKANVNSQENLITTIRRKLGKPVTHQQYITISEQPNYKSERFIWVIYGIDDVRLLIYEY
jgi:hypothetical protein